MPKISAPPPSSEVVFEICHEGLGKTKKKLRQNQGPLRYEAGELPARDDVQLYGNVNPVSITIELNVLNFKIDLFNGPVPENSLFAVNFCTMWGFLSRLYRHRARRQRCIM